jgi:hypothetical protein
MSPNKSIDTDVLSAGVSRRPSPVISNYKGFPIVRPHHRGPVWWTDGAPDFNRKLVKNTPYRDWFSHLGE